MGFYSICIFLWLMVLRSSVLEMCRAYLIQNLGIKYVLFFLIAADILDAYLGPRYLSIMVIYLIGGIVLFYFF